jgi:hypothetical protein
MTKIPRNAVARVVEAIMETPDLKRATLYLDDRTVVKATRIHKVYACERSHSLVLTYGKPNYAERKFIALCKKAGEPLPVRKIQLKWYPVKRKKK